MGSKTFDGVRFQGFSDDHIPPHLHGFYAGIEVIVELTVGGVRLARRKNAIRPSGAKQSDVKRILRAADKHSEELLKLWNIARGETAW